MTMPPKIETNPIITLLFEALKGVDPTVDSSTTTEEKKVQELDPSLLADVLAFNNAKKIAKFAKQEKKRHEKRIRDALKGADVGTINGRAVVTVVHSHNSHCDSELLRNVFPEAYAASHKETAFDYLKVPAGVSESA